MNWQQLHALRAGNVHVVGLASTEGAAMARFLHAEGFRSLTVHDFQPEERIRQAFLRMHVGLPPDERLRLWDEIRGLPVERRLGDAYLQGIEAADAVFVGQAWQLYGPNLPVLPDLRGRGVPFHGLTELYFGLSAAPIVAVTGSNGKSTTSRLIEAMLRSATRTVYYAGNERRSVQVLDRLREMDARSVLVLEVSNRQLADLQPRPAVGVITAILPNHLDEHSGSFEEYREVKRRLVAFQSSDDTAVLNRDDPACLEVSRGLGGRVWWFSREREVERGAWLRGSTIVVRAGAGDELSAGPVSASPLRGAHNEANLLAAACAARAVGADADAIVGGVVGFPGLRHRMQFVWRARGVDYYDDLNATSPQATAAALRTLDGPVVLICGGDDKGLDFADLADLVVQRVERLILLPGPGSDRLADAVERAGSRAGGPAVERYEVLEEAVLSAAGAAAPGSTVLLSPACPNFFSRHYVAGDTEVGFRAVLRRVTGEATEGDRHG